MLLYLLRISSLSPQSSSYYYFYCQHYECHPHRESVLFGLSCHIKHIKGTCNIGEHEVLGMKYLKDQKHWRRMSQRILQLNSVAFSCYIFFDWIKHTENRKIIKKNYIKVAFLRIFINIVLLQLKKVLSTSWLCKCVSKKTRVYKHNK